LAPENGGVKDWQLKPGGPLMAAPKPGFRCFVTIATQARSEEQDTFRALSVYLSPARLPPATCARMRQGAPVMTIVQSERAAVAAREPAVCVGRA